MRGSEPQIAEPGRPVLFEFLSGDVALDFANTVDVRPRPDAGELLANYADLVSWSRQAGIIGDADAEDLLRRSRQAPDGAERAHRRAIDLRETIFAIFSAVAERRPLPAPALERLERFAHDAARKRSLVAAGAGVAWEWNGNNDLESMLWPLLDRAVSLVTSDRLARVKMCEGETCSRLFVDTSQKQNRRWCDMTRCGNRAKARRHYERTKGIIVTPRAPRAKISREERPGAVPTAPRANPPLPPRDSPRDDAPPVDDEAHDRDGFVWM